MTDTASRSPLPSQWAVAVPGLALLAAGGVFLWQNGDSWKFGVLFAIGTLLGVSLYHAAFGFTAAWRNAFQRRDIAGVKAQILMVGLAIILFSPTMAGGVSAAGTGVVGGLAPVGWEVALGSFIFGIGMQLGGGCGSGTLFTVGGGSTRMTVTLFFFCAGAFLATLYTELWAPLSAGSETIALGREFGWGIAMAGQLAFLAAIWVALAWWARGREQKSIWDGRLSWRRLLTGPWPLLLSGVMLALLNWTVLEITGHAWSITWGFTLWAGEIAQWFGWDPQSSAFWQARAGILARGVLVDDTSITDFGIILGALIAAGFAGRFEPVLKIPAKSLLAAVLGGLLLGIGARMAYGCNIGAFFSGVASSSLHGWVWILFALPGNWLGIQMRPAFGLAK